MKPDILLENRQSSSALAGDIFRLYGLARWSRAELFVEIGVGCGASTGALLLAAEENDGRVVSIDIDENCGRLFDSNPRWQFVCADSRNPQLPAQLNLQAIPFLFLDSSHGGPETEQELSIWLPLIAQGGLVMFHDVKTYRQTVGVAIESYLRAHNDDWTYRECADSQHGLGVMERVK